MRLLSLSLSIQLNNFDKNLFFFVLYEQNKNNRNY